MDYTATSAVPNEVSDRDVHSIVIISTLAICLLAMYLNMRSNKLPLPPGPARLPFIGNVFNLPREREYLTFARWRKVYGEVVYLSIFNRSVVVLNSARTAFDLLHKRSSLYSDRPYLAMSGDLVGWNHTLALMPYGDQFLQMRRIMHQVLSTRPAQSFWPTQEQETVRFLRRLLTNPENFVAHIRYALGAVALKISHGYAVSETGIDPLVALAEQTLKEFSLSVAPGAFMVDFLPLLKYVPSWFPGAGFHRTALAWRKNLFRMTDEAHDFTKDQIAKGVAIPSLTSKYLENEHSSEIEFLVKWTAFSVFSGGADTTVAALTTFFLAMCLHPKVQSKAQAELDTVVGNQRLPTMADKTSLPYIDTLLKEVLRWGTVGPLGIPHRLTSQSDEYEGYRIPAGSTIIPNIWEMTHDPEFFPSPHEFRPERYNEEQTPDTPFADPLRLAFGFGRRICPGQHLVESTMFLSIAMTLATFDIEKSRDESSGEIISPVAEWLPGTISHPKPFVCQIKPRSARAVELINQATKEL